ncbi:MAG: hypothetical protein WC799_00120 [Desulfobacteraceae bacterium]|jgi:hypothetical protein
MKLNLLLWILSAKLKMSARNNARFISFIRSKHLRFAIRTADGKSNREFTFSNGKISSRSGTSGTKDFTMVWSDAHTGFKAMSSKNEEVSVAALTEKKLQVEGNLKEFMWFSRAVDIMMGKA